MTKEELLSMNKEQIFQLPVTEFPTANNTGCRDCRSCVDCKGCADCIGTKNGKNLQYVAYGIQLTEKEYRNFVEKK